MKAIESALPPPPVRSGGLLAAVGLEVGDHADWHWYPGQVERVVITGEHANGKELVFRPLDEEALYHDEPHMLRKAAN